MEFVRQVTHLYPQQDGSTIKIHAAEQLFSQQACVTVSRQAREGDVWRVLGDRPAPGWKTMPLPEYEAHGRPERLRYVTHGQILRATSLLGKPLTDVH